MLRVVLKRASSASVQCLYRVHRPLYNNNSHRAISTVRSYSTNGQNSTYPIALQMIKYAFSHARNQKSEASYEEGLLVLEQGLSNLRRVDLGDQTSAAMFLLAMSRLLYEREREADAIDKLKKIIDMDQSSLGVIVAAYEGLIRIHLEKAQDITPLELADKCLQMLESRLEVGSDTLEALRQRANSTKGLIELIKGNISSESYFNRCKYNDSLEDKCCLGDVALSRGEFYHASGNFLLAKDFYKKALVASETDGSSDASLATFFNMNAEVSLAATCALGQLATHSGNFEDAEETLTKALTKAEEIFGLNHPNVGVVLTCIAMMYGQKAKLEKSSSIMIQEGLYRKAIDLLKAPPIYMPSSENGSHKAKELQYMKRRDIMALARGGYAEVLCVQHNRKEEGAQMKKWAEHIWMNQQKVDQRNRQLSLAEALEMKEPSKVAVIDARVNRVI